MTETEDESGRMFAYCGNKNEGCPCPAVAAGFDPENDASIIVAKHYDSKVLDGGYDEEMKNIGFDEPQPIPEEQAREAWVEAIDELKKQEPTLSDGTEPHEIAVEIAEELGWR